MHWVAKPILEKDNLVACFLHFKMYCPSLRLMLYASNESLAFNTLHNTLAMPLPLASVTAPLKTRTVSCAHTDIGNRSRKKNMCMIFTIVVPAYYSDASVYWLRA